MRIETRCRCAMSLLLGSSNNLYTGVVLSAPTGKAAYNIEGMINHASFQIDPNRGYDYKKLPSDKLNTLRAKYRHLAAIVIDEVSMVGNKQFLFIHEGLQEIQHLHLLMLLTTYFHLKG